MHGCCGAYAPVRWGIADARWSGADRVDATVFRARFAWHYLAVPNEVVVYSVRAQLPDAATRERYVEWLRGGHCQAVVRTGGALSGEVTVLEDGSVESRYVFGSRADFEAYEGGPAIALRADSALRFPPDSNVRLVRSLGVRVARAPD